MPAVLGMQDGNSIRLHVISLGNVFHPLMPVMTLQINSKVLQQLFAQLCSYTPWTSGNCYCFNLHIQLNNLCSNLANSLGIKLSLEKLGAVRWQMVGVHELLSRSFVCSLVRKKKQQWMFKESLHKYLLLRKGILTMSICLVLAIARVMFMASVLLVYLKLLGCWR